MVEDHSASAEYTGDAEPDLGPDVKPGITPEPAQGESPTPNHNASTREVRPEYRLVPRGRLDGFSLPSGYRSDLERAAASDLSAGPAPVPSSGTAFFGAAPAVAGNLSHGSDNRFGDRPSSAEQTTGDERADSGGAPSSQSSADFAGAQQAFSYGADAQPAQYGGDVQPAGHSHDGRPAEYNGNDRAAEHSRDARASEYNRDGRPAEYGGDGRLRGYAGSTGYGAGTRPTAVEQAAGRAGFGGDQQIAGFGGGDRDADWGMSTGRELAGAMRSEGDGRANPDGGSNDTPAETVGPVTNLGDAWTRVLAGLPPNQRAWLTNSRPVTLHESTAIVAVPDDFTRGQLETRLRPDLERILTESFGRDIRIAVTVDPSLDPEVREQQQPPQPVVREPLRTEGVFQPTIQSALTDPDTTGQQFGQPTRQEAAGHHFDQPAGAAPQLGAPQLGGPRLGAPQQPFGQQLGSVAPLPNGSAPTQPATEAQGEARLNPKYTFETFVIGSSNRFAHAAAVAVAEAPGKAYNPQLIYGDSGLGKTHLLHAIGHYVRSLYTGARVRYVSSEEFTNDFINAIRDDKASQFQRRYRDVDVLLIDDIQFLEGKIQTQEEFFHTFNTLHNANKQIVISSDRAPKRLEALEDRLRNRFEWGLITDIQPPDLETRIAILRKKAATERLTAPPEVLEFIASKVQTNIRELEGALIRVTAFASLNRQPVDLSLAEIVLKDLIPEGSKPEVTASMIMGQTASYFGLSIDDLCGSSRSRVLVTARQIAMYLCRELTDLSLPKIGQQFGGRDHTTVMHAERKIRQLMSERRSVFNQVTELTNRIKHQAKQQ